MSDGVKFIFKTLFKVPIFILAAYLILNVLGLVTTYFKVQGVEYGLTNIVTENNYISRSDLTKLMPQLWALGYHYDGTTWTKIDYVDEIGFYIVGDDGSANWIAIDPPNATGTNANSAAQNALTAVNNCFTSLDKSPMNRTQYGHAKVIGFYANYAIIWPLTVYNDPSGGAFSSGNAAVAGYNNGNWQTDNDPPVETSGGIFTGGQRRITVPISMNDTVVGIKYYSDMY